jgi:hypothetical protein
MGRGLGCGRDRGFDNGSFPLTPALSRPTGEGEASHARSRG